MSQKHDGSQVKFAELSSFACDCYCLLWIKVKLQLHVAVTLVCPLDEIAHHSEGVLVLEERLVPHSPYLLAELSYKILVAFSLG